MEKREGVENTLISAHSFFVAKEWVAKDGERRGGRGSAGLHNTRF